MYVHASLTPDMIASVSITKVLCHRKTTDGVMWSKACNIIDHTLSWLLVKWDLLTNAMLMAHLVMLPQLKAIVFCNNMDNMVSRCHMFSTLTHYIHTYSRDLRGSKFQARTHSAPHMPNPHRTSLSCGGPHPYRKLTWKARPAPHRTYCLPSPQRPALK